MTSSWRKKAQESLCFWLKKERPRVKGRDEETSVKRRKRGRKRKDRASGASPITLVLSSYWARWVLGEKRGLRKNFSAMIRGGWLEAKPDGAQIGRWQARDGPLLALVPLINQLGSF